MYYTCLFIRRADISMTSPQLYQPLSPSEALAIAQRYKAKSIANESRISSEIFEPT